MVFAFLRSREGNQATGAIRLRNDKLKVVTNNLESLTACLVLSQLDFFRVAESAFCTQPTATAVSATASVDTIPTQTHTNAHFLVHVPQRIICTFPMLAHRTGSRWEGVCVTYSSALISISLDMSLLSLPFSRFPQVLSSPTCPTSLCDCYLVRWQWTKHPVPPLTGVGCLADWLNRPKTQLTSPTCTVTWTRHTPINFPDSFQCRDDATIISAADPEVPYSGASSSSKQTAASRVPTILGSWGASFWKQRPELVDSRSSIQATGANVDRESVDSTVFRSQSKEKRDRDQNVVHSSRDKSPENPWAESWLCRPRRNNGSAEIVWSWGWSWGENLGEEKLWHRFQEINQEFESQRFQVLQAGRWADQGQRDKSSLHGELELRNRLFQVLQETFLKDPAQEGLSSTIFDRSKNLASSSQEYRPDTTETARKRDSEMKRESLNTSVSLPHFRSRSGMLNHTGGTYSRSGMMDYPRILVTEWNLGKIHDSMEFHSWKVNFKTGVCTRTADPQITMHWIKEVEIAKSIDEPVTSRSIVARTDFPDFDMLDAVIASALKKLLNTQTHFQKRASVEEQRAQNSDRFLRGRRIAYMIYEHFRATWLLQQYKDFQLCSQKDYRMTMFKISTSDGIKHY